MGIKGLWSVLTPYCEKKSLHEMCGEKVAVDLAGWVCDSQHAVDHRAAHKLYLRNLFFRTSWLLLCDVQPVFVLEGSAPGLKQGEMARRAGLRHGGGATDLARRRFNTILSECSALLRCMGVSCVRASGEAEAACAALNAHKLVDAVISQDSDSFAYGAQRVYRNFTVSGSGGGGGSSVQGSVQCYDIQQINKFIDFGRNKMVALAALCGSDYGAGAVGTSLAATLAFLHTVSDADVLQRLESWSSDGARYEELEARMRDSRAGVCPHCASAIPGVCSHPQHKTGAAAIRRELALRARALAFSAAAGEPFPSPCLRTEFLSEAPTTPAPSPPRPPDLLAFVKLMRDKLGWSERYSVEKLLPLVTRAHLAATTHDTSHLLRPKRILAKRKPRGVPCLEVLWTSVNAAYDGLVPDDQLKDGESVEDVWRTCEPRDALQRRYPDLVDDYDARSVHCRRRRRTPAAAPAKPTSLVGQPETYSLSTSFRNMSLCEPAGDEHDTGDNNNGNVMMDEDSSYEEDDFTEGDLSHLIEDIVSDGTRPLMRPTMLGQDAVTLLFGDKAM